MTDEVSPKPIDLAREAAFRLGPAEIRPATREAVWPDQREMLEPRVMQVLVALARRRGEVVSRDDLIGDCWGGRIVGDDAINRCIGQLRRLAERVGGFEVETVARVGYRLVDQATAPPSRRRRVLIVAGVAGAAAVAAIAAIAGAWWFTQARPHPNGDAKVVVAGVKPLGADPLVQRFAQSLGDNLVGGLAASMVPAGSQGAAGADFVVQGVVEADGSDLRASLHLTDGRTGTALWSASFTGPAKGQGGLRERATVAVAAAVRCAVRAHAPGAGPIGAAALQRFLRACSLMDDPGATQDILTNLRHVTQDAPQFAPGYATLAVFAAEAEREVDPLLAPPLRVEGAAAAHKALALAPKEGTAYQALEMLVEPHSNWPERQRLLSRGLALDPANSNLAARQGLMLAGQGRFKEAVIFQRQAVALDPASANNAAELGDTLAAMGSLGQAARVLIRADSLWPQNDHVAGVIFAVAALNGHEREALSMLQDRQTKNVGAEQPERAIWIATLKAMLSRSPDELAKARAMVKDAARDHVIWPPDAVRALSALGDADGALTLADSFAAQHPDYEPTYLFKSGTDALRKDPRFMRLAQHLGLVAYWRSQNRWPDFCAARTLPYSCQVEAARLEAAR